MLFSAADDGNSDGREAKRIKRVDEHEPRSLSEVILDDLLATEILPRLADSRTAIRCTAVSKHWRSLLSAPEFVPNFLRRRRRRSSYAMFVEFRFQKMNKCFQHLFDRHLIVEGSKVAIGFTVDHDFAWLICGRRIVLDSACDDLILFSSAITKKQPKRHLHIRNAVTGRWLELPELPVKEQDGYSFLVSRPGPSPSSPCSYRVVYITRISKDDGGPDLTWSTIFSSDSGRWSSLAPAPELKRIPTVVAVNGLLFLLSKARESVRLVMFDAFVGSWRFVLLPADFLLAHESYHGSAVEFGPAEEVEQLGSSKNTPLIVAVQGRLRLAQLFRPVSSDGVFVIKIWELSGDGEKWVPVGKDVKLRVPPFRVEETKWVYLSAFDPDDTDVMFICCDWEVFRYQMRRCEYKRALRLSCTKGDEDRTINDSLPRFTQVFTVSLPPWPTSIPVLPSSSSASAL